MKENIRTKLTPKDAPKGVKKFTIKKIKLIEKISITKSYDDNVLDKRIKRLEQRLRELDRPPAYNSNVQISDVFSTNSFITFP